MRPTTGGNSHYEEPWKSETSKRNLDAEKFAAMISALNLKPPVLIKPNWGTVECFSEAEIPCQETGQLRLKNRH